MKNSERTMKEKLMKIQKEHAGYNLYTEPLMKNFGEAEVAFKFKRKSDKIEWWYLNNYWGYITEGVPTKVLKKLEEIKKLENFNEFLYSITCDTMKFFDLTTNSNILKYTAYIQKNFEEFSIRFVLDNTFDIDGKRNINLVVVKNSKEIWKKRLSENASCAPFFEEVDKHFEATVGKIKWIKKEVLRLINQDKLDAEFEKLIG